MAHSSKQDLEDKHGINSNFIIGKICYLPNYFGQMSSVSINFCFSLYENFLSLYVRFF